MLMAVSASSVPLKSMRTFTPMPNGDYLWRVNDHAKTRREVARPLEDAIGAPRFHPVTRRAGQAENRFETEKETDYRVADALREKFGWKDGTDAETESFGGFNAVEVMPDGRRRGYADQRRSNTAMGY